MLRTLKTEKADKALRAAAYVLMAVCAGAFLLTEVRFAFKAGILDVLPYPVWLVSLCWLVRGDLRRPVYWLGLAFIAWFGVTRLLLKDSQGSSFLLEVSIIYAFCLPFARGTGDAKRLRFFDGLAAAFVLVMTAASLAGLWTVVSGRTLTTADGRYFTGIDAEALRLKILGVNPNTCGLLMAMAILLVLYLLLRRFTPRRLLLALALIIPNYFALAATDSRLSELALVGAVLPAGAVIASAAMKRSFRGRRAAVAATAIAAALLCYAGFGACVNILNGLSAAEETVLTEMEGEKAGAVSPAPALEQRDMLDSYTSGRAEVYSSALLYLKDHPAVLYRGADNYSIRMMSAYAHEITDRWYYMKLHLHNSFFQTLAATGLPGLALILAVCVLLLISSLRLLRSPARSAAEKLLPALLLLLILDSAGESPLFVPYDEFSNAFFDLFFFLCAGYVTELGSRDADA